MDRRKQFKNIPEKIVNWIFPLLLTIGLNLIFFLAVPNLTQRKNPPRPFASVPAGVQFLRQPPHVEKPQAEKIKKRELKPRKNRKTKKKPAPHPGGPIPEKLLMPFELNPRLPAGPATLQLPPLETVKSFQPGKLPRVFPAGQLDNSLTPMVRIPPVYPILARRRGIEGWVKVKFTVNRRGIVTDISIIEANPGKIFDEAVRRCVRQWRFRPGTIGGIAVDAEVTTTIRFRLE
jgi:protein TonB